MYVLIKNDVVETYPYSVNQLYADNPNTSFPNPTPDSTLAEFGVFPVVPIPQPAYDPVTQNLTELNPIPELNLWFQQWGVTQASPEEVAERKEQLKQENKQKASNLLQQTDWTSFADVGSQSLSNPYLVNQSEFIVYRSQLRQIAVYPEIDSIFPSKPDEVWSDGVINNQPE